MPFDRVELSSPEGSRTLSVQQFCDMPLADRLRAVLERRVNFFQGSTLVESREALKALRERAA
ncbi:MAG: hypothetical protein QM778_22275 [Myxococcales bacterium]